MSPQDHDLGKGLQHTCLLPRISPYRKAQHYLGNAQVWYGKNRMNAPTSTVAGEPLTSEQAGSLTGNYVIL